jgi:hypothetical protein
MHSGAGLAPIEVVTLCDFLTPKPVIVRVGCERREDMMALPASENVNAKLVENGALPQTSAQQALQGRQALVCGLSHLLLPHFPGTAIEIYTIKTQSMIYAIQHNVYRQGR